MEGKTVRLSENWGKKAPAPLWLADPIREILEAF